MHFSSLHSWFSCSVCFYLKCSSSQNQRVIQRVKKHFFVKICFKSYITRPSKMGIQHRTHLEQSVYMAKWKDMNKQTRKEQSNRIKPQKKGGQYSVCIFDVSLRAFGAQALYTACFADYMQNTFPAFWTISNSLRQFHHDSPSIHKIHPLVGEGFPCGSLKKCGKVFGWGLANFIDHKQPNLGVIIGERKHSGLNIEVHAMMVLAVQSFLQSKCLQFKWEQSNLECVE